MITRRSFIGITAAGLCFTAVAQDQQPDPIDQFINQITLIMPGRTDAVEKAASSMVAGNTDSIRAVVEELFKLPRMLMPPPIDAVVKQRIIDAQIAYLDGKTSGVSESSIVDAINALVTPFEAPDYARVSLLQAQYLRSRLAVFMPALYKPVRPDLAVGEPNAPMSPVQGFFVLAVLIQQKLENGPYQVSPDDWDRDVYPKLIEQERAQKELQRRIAAGEVKVQATLRGRVGMDHADGSLLFLVQERVRAMSVMDGLKLFDQTFARLGM